MINLPHPKPARNATITTSQNPSYEPKPWLLTLYTELYMCTSLSSCYFCGLIGPGLANVNGLMPTSQ